MNTKTTISLTIEYRSWYRKLKKHRVIKTIYRKYINDVISLINILSKPEVESYEKQGTSIKVTNINLEQETSWIRPLIVHQFVSYSI